MADKAEQVKQVEKAVEKLKTLIDRNGFKIFTMSVIDIMHEESKIRNFTDFLSSLNGKYETSTMNDYYYPKDNSKIKAIMKSPLMARIIVDYNLEHHLIAALTGAKYRVVEGKKPVRPRKNQHPKTTVNAKKQQLLKLLND